MNCSVFLDPRQNPSVTGNDLRTKILSQFMNVPDEPKPKAARKVSISRKSPSNTKKPSFMLNDSIAEEQPLAKFGGK